jgi:hypothetical protein
MLRKENRRKAQQHVAERRMGESRSRCDRCSEPSPGADVAGCLLRTAQQKVADNEHEARKRDHLHRIAPHHSLHCCILQRVV